MNNVYAQITAVAQISSFVSLSDNERRSIYVECLCIFFRNSFTNVTKKLP